MYNNYPMMRPGLFARGLNLTRSLNWGSLLDGTQKTLGVINQAIPIFHQVQPMIHNARTLFKIADVIRTPDEVNTRSSSKSTGESVKSTSVNTNKPIFYI